MCNVESIHPTITLHGSSTQRKIGLTRKQKKALFLNRVSTHMYVGGYFDPRKTVPFCKKRWLSDDSFPVLLRPFGHQNTFATKHCSFIC